MTSNVGGMDRILRIAMGADALEKVRRKLDFVAREVEQWKGLSTSTGFPG